MTPVFFTMADDCIAEYIEINKPLRDVSKKYRLVTVCSGTKAPDMMNRLYRTEILECDNSFPVKGDVLLKYLKKTSDYDCVIKIDLDALIFDIRGLLNLISANLKPMSLMGNRRKHYIRGGCNALNADLTPLMNSLSEHGSRPNKFDDYYCAEVLRTGGKLQDRALFEMSKSYTRTLPVWHPHKRNKLKYIAKGITGYAGT